MKKVLATSLMLLALAPTLAGCGAREVRIITTEMKFDPATISARPGESIKFVIENKGEVRHEFVSDELKFEEVEVDPGEVKSVTVKVPKQPGEYSFYCEQKGHTEAGMTGKVVVSDGK